MAGATDGEPVDYAAARRDEHIESLGRRLAAVELASVNRRNDNAELHAFVWGVVIGVIVVVLVVRCALSVAERWHPYPPREDMPA